MVSRMSWSAGSMAWVKGSGSAGNCSRARMKRWARSSASNCKTRAKLSSTCPETVIARPCSSQVYQVAPTPASRASSSLRSPGVLRRVPGGNPTCWGLRARSTHHLWENRLSSISSKDGPRFSSVASSGILPGGDRAILHSCSSLRPLEHLLLTSFTRLFGVPILNFTNEDINSSTRSQVP